MTAPVNWTPEMDETIRQMWPHANCPAIADAIGVGRTAIWKHATRGLGLPPKRKYVATNPPRVAWIKAATIAARNAGLSYDEVIGGRTHAAAQARWEAYAAILEKYPRVSLAGLGRVSGYHHATIMHGLLRRRGAGYKELRARGRSIAELREAA